MVVVNIVRDTEKFKVGYISAIALSVCALSAILILFRSVEKKFKKKSKKEDKKGKSKTKEENNVPE